MYNKRNSINTLLLNVTAIFYFTFFGGLLFGQVSIYNTEKVECRGKVKSIHMILYCAETYFEEIKKGSKCDYDWKPRIGTQNVERLVNFDISGNIIRDTRYDWEHCVLHSDDLTYDNYNNVTEIKKTFFNDSICQLLFFKTSERHLTFRNSYNETSQLVKTTCIINDVITSEYLYKYDSIGNLREITWINPKEKRNKTCFYKFDSVGHIVEYTDWHWQGLGKYNYDSKGNCIEEINYSNQEDLSTGFSELITYKYNQENYKTSESHYAGNGNRLRTENFEYEYDSKNNWIKCLEY